MAHSKCGAFTVGKGWRRTIGRKIGDGGRLIPCRFWLGMDKPRATATALSIESLWVGLDAPYWSVEAFKAAEGVRMGATVKDAPRLLPLPPKATAVLTVKGMIERYRSAYAADANHSEPSKHSVACRTKALERSPIANMPLAEVGAEQLAELIAFWLARPIAPSTDAPISECSARIIVKTARAVFDHADAVGFWQAPRRFDRLFRLPKVKTAPTTIKTFSVAELARLYKQAEGQMKLLILLALNCGFCSAELSTLRRDEIDLDAKTIRRARQKTAVVAEWKLWDETVKALKENMQAKGELALATDGGKPLMFYSPKGHRVDVIPNRWNRLLRRANADGGATIHGSFKLLRKTGATMVRAIGGVEVSETYLAHSEKTVARFYSTPSPQHLQDALTTFRKQLAPMLRKRAK
jgi:integrase